MPNPNQEIAHELLSHQDFLRRLANDLVGGDADDLVQEVWQRALERPPKHGRQLRGWLARVARNLAANRWRGQARRVEREERRATEQPAAEEVEARFELRKELVGALDALPASSREAILLRYFEGLAPHEIARRSDVPVATVKTRLRRGLAQLREALDERYDGDRSTWMSAVTALGAPVGGGVATGTLAIGGIAVGTMMKVSAAAVIAAVGVAYFLNRTPESESPRIAAVEPPEAGVELEGAGLVSAARGSPEEAERQSVVADEAPVDAAIAAGEKVLRVVLDGVTEEDALLSTITLFDANPEDKWRAPLWDTWACDGLTTELDLDPFFASVTERYGDLRLEELKVRVDHPLLLAEIGTVSLSEGVESRGGKTVYEVAVRLADVVFWPEFELSVRDADTRAHLDDVSLRFVPTAFMGQWRRPGEDDPFSAAGGDLSSPIVLQGGRRGTDPEDRVAGLAVVPAAGDVLELTELTQPEVVKRGVVVYARAPGYAWGKLVLDVSTGAERELLLDRGTDLTVRVANFHPESYAALPKKPTLYVAPIGPDGPEWAAWVEGLDETFDGEPIRLEGLAPGDYRISVELGGAFTWRKRDPQVTEELYLAAGERREVVLSLPAAPAPREHVTVAGSLSFPAFGGEEDVRLAVYLDDYVYGDPDFALTLDDMEPAAGELPTWAFRFEDLPVGRHEMQVYPFQEFWTIEIPSGGREDVELTISELAEVIVETVDARTGELVPVEVVRYGTPEVPGGQMGFREARAGYDDVPGRFRLWVAPGPGYVRAVSIPDGWDYGMRRKDLTFEPGIQSLRLELQPTYAITFEFLDGGAALPKDDSVYFDVLFDIEPVGHAGEVSGISYGYAEANMPGLYEIHFENVGTDRFQPIPNRQVEVRAGEPTEVVIELKRL